MKLAQVHVDGSKNRGFYPKMDGENNGSKPYEQMDGLGGGEKHPYFWFNTHVSSNFFPVLFSLFTDPTGCSYSPDDHRDVLVVLGCFR